MNRWSSIKYAAKPMTGCAREHGQAMAWTRGYRHPQVSLRGNVAQCGSRNPPGMGDRSALPSYVSCTGSGVEFHCCAACAHAAQVQAAGHVCDCGTETKVPTMPRPIKKPPPPPPAAQPGLVVVSTNGLETKPSTPQGPTIITPQGCFLPGNPPQPIDCPPPITEGEAGQLPKP